MKHLEFVNERESTKGLLSYNSEALNVKVMTNQEKKLFLPFLNRIKQVNDNEYEVSYLEENPIDIINKKSKEQKSLSEY